MNSPQLIRSFEINDVMRGGKGKSSSRECKVCHICLEDKCDEEMSMETSEVRTRSKKRRRSGRKNIYDILMPSRTKLKSLKVVLRMNNER